MNAVDTELLYLQLSGRTVSDCQTHITQDCGQASETLIEIADSAHKDEDN